jgi:shikimate dehydrogenase
MKHACVIGWPISHSRSPLIHSYWIRQHGLDASYTRLPVEPENLKAFTDKIRQGDYVGCNVTLPHKEAMAALVDHIDERSARVGSVNTVYLRNGELYATSTDGEGFCQNLKHHVNDFQFTGSQVMILGAGGSARAIVDELLRRGAERVTIVNRTLDRARQFEDIFGQKVKAIAWSDITHHAANVDLLVNTTSLGMQGQPQLKLDLAPFATRTSVADIIYAPLKTALLQQAETRGHAIIPGLGMLLHQAVKGFELWFGVTPTVTDELHDLVARDIDPDYRRP